MPSLTDSFVGEVERRILTGEWAVGSKIPPLRVLAEEFHVSRSVINAGIVELANNGYLTTVPRQYTCVSDWRKTGTFALLNGLMENGLYDDAFFTDLLEGRMTIEKAIAGKAATARTESDVAELKAILEREKRTQSPEERAQTDGEFHHALAVASHNLVYAVILNSFNSVASRFIRAFYGKGIDEAFVIDTHERLIGAVEQGKAAEAEEIMEILLTHGEKELKNNKKI